MKTNVVLFLVRLSAMIVAAMATSPMQAQTMSFLRQFTTPGTDRAAAIAADGSGIYVIGNRPAEQGLQAGAGVRKYDSRGAELWTREFSVPTSARVTLSAAAVDATGLYVLGFDPVTGQGVLRKYSPGGGEVWTRQLEFAPRGLAVDAGGVYVAGRDLPPGASSLRKYNADGAQLWTSRFGDRNNVYNPQVVAVDATGVYMFGLKFT
ncbi:MAG: hypothetical protein ABIZ80_00580, partial [Bryobacteraceae bacterium]